MSKPILVRGARQLLTLVGPAGPRRGTGLGDVGMIPDGAVLIVDGLIRETGTTRRLENLAECRQATEINAAGRVVMPGFVDSHTHLVGGPARLADLAMRAGGASEDEIEKAGGGYHAITHLLRDIPTSKLQMQASRVVSQTIREGTTTLEAKSGYGNTESGEVKILRTHARLNERFQNIVSTFMGARSACRDGSDADKYADWLCSHMLPLVWRRRLAEFVDVCCEPTEFGVEQARRILTRARELGFLLKLHAGQHGDAGGIGLGLELGATSIDHAVFVDEVNMAALAASNTIVTLLPGPAFLLGLPRYPSARTLIDRGAAVALASNYNSETCPTHNMQTIVSIACREMNLSAAEAISAATINGAYAVNRAERIGSLEFGKDADLIMLSVPDYREIPYHFGVNLVELTMKRGQVIYQASEVKCPSN